MVLEVQYHQNTSQMMEYLLETVWEKQMISKWWVAFFKQLHNRFLGLNDPIVNGCLWFP